MRRRDCLLFLVAGAAAWPYALRAGQRDRTRFLDILEKAKRDYARKLNFLDFAPLHFISARAGTGVVSMLKSVDAAYASAMAKLSTPKLTRALIAAVQKQSPPRSGVSRPKLRYAHQGGMNPPVIVVHGNSLEHVTDAYKRFLEGRFRKEFKLVGTPLRIEMKTSKNPYADEKD